MRDSNSKNTPQNEFFSTQTETEDAICARVQSDNNKRSNQAH